MDEVEAAMVAKSPSVTESLRIHPELDERTSLSRCLLLRRLPPSAWHDLTRTANTRRLRTGEFLCRQAEVVANVYVLLRGRISVVRVSSRGSQVLLRFHYPGDAFACAHAVSRSPAPASLQASQDSVVLAWDGKPFISLLRRYPRMVENFAAVIVQHNRETLAHLEETLIDSCERRLARAMQRGFDAAPRDGRGLEFHLTEQQMAEYLGTSPYTISRILSRWRREGVVDVHRGRVRVVTPEALCSLANGFGRL